jgi:hypothetical protein
MKNLRKLLQLILNHFLNIKKNHFAAGCSRPSKHDNNKCMPSALSVLNSAANKPVGANRLKNDESGIILYLAGRIDIEKRTG